jgi:hypothetical protein
MNDVDRILSVLDTLQEHGARLQKGATAADLNETRALVLKLTEAVRLLPRSSEVRFRKVTLAAPEGLEEEWRDLVEALRAAGLSVA